MSTEGGENVLTMMGIPGMRKQLFKRTEDFLGEAIKNLLVSSMAEAGEREKNLAISSNQFHQGVPSISVVVDGGWSKRSHKQSYNAKSGVGVVFGLATKKLLFLGVRNKYCSVCPIAEHKEVESPKHLCYRNWSGSSCAMESDIVVEGFRLSESTRVVPAFMPMAILLSVRYIKL